MNFLSIASLPKERYGVNETSFRSYGILQLVKDLLSREIPPDVVLNVIETLESAPNVPSPSGEPLPPVTTYSYPNVGIAEAKAQHLRKRYPGDPDNCDSGAFFDGEGKNVSVRG